MEKRVDNDNSTRGIHSLKLTARLPPKIGGWETIFPPLQQTTSKAIVVYSACHLCQGLSDITLGQPNSGKRVHVFLSEVAKLNLFK